MTREILVHQVEKMQNEVSTEELQNITNIVLDDLKFESIALNIVFVDDDVLKNMHKDYLDDPTKTDVITFNLSDDLSEGEIYISSDRARFQADEYKVSIKNEVYRLIIHGILHLKGYNDLHDDERIVMKAEEERLLHRLTEK